MDDLEDIVPWGVRLNAVPHPYYLIAERTLQTLEIICLADGARDDYVDSRSVECVGDVVGACLWEWDAI